MIDTILSQYPAWRYCNIPPGTKGPRESNWQHRRNRLDEITSTNLGILLGPYSGGVAAIDFDGPSAWDWYDQNINVPLPDTATWASGRTGRCQMAFQIPEEYWEFLHTKKIGTGVIDLSTSKEEGIEFRWAGVQSVLPPSIHPDTKKPYFWLNSGPVADMPEDILCYWLNAANPVVERDMNITDIETISNTEFDEIAEILETLKKDKPTLNYDEWRTVSWAVAKKLGKGGAKLVMQEYYPPLSKGEYDQIFKGYDAGKSPSLGSVVFLMGGNTKRKSARAKRSIKGLKNQNIL